jgi:very-short-patch-repair endonuclease
VLACGEGAALSHRTAAALWGMRPQSGVLIHVTVPTASGRSKRDGIAIHRSRTLLPSQTTLRRGVPVTNPARTLADLKRTASRNAYESAVRQAEILRLDTGPQGQPDPDPDRTQLERRFVALCRRHALPRPLTQQVVGPYTVDFLWPMQRLVVEVDGYGSHGGRSAFEDDRARDAQLALLGHEVIRFTWRQIGDAPATVVAVMRGLLDRRP